MDKVIDFINVNRDRYLDERLDRYPNFNVEVAARVRYLGRRDGEVTQATKQIATLAAKDKPAYGAAVNEAKARIEAEARAKG